MTPRLYHGPEARDRAVAWAESIGLPSSDPIGDKGLKVEDSRKIIELATHSGVGDRAPCVVVGPLDQASPEASDALLKTLEDLCEAPLRIILWADYLSGVSGTVRSRCEAFWCPEGRTYLDPLDYMRERAIKLLQHLQARDHARVVCLLQEVGASEWVPLLEALCTPLSRTLSEGDSSLVEVWLRVREVLDGRGSLLTAVDALLPSSLDEEPS